MRELMVEVEGDQFILSTYPETAGLSTTNIVLRRRAYVILFRLCRQLDSTFRGCFPCDVQTVHLWRADSSLVSCRQFTCDVQTVHPTLLSFAIFSR